MSAGAAAPYGAGATRTRFQWLAAAHLWRATGRVARNRADLYGGASGLRIGVFHATPPRTLDELDRIAGWWSERRPMATPADVDELIAGRWRGGRTDRLLLTFDDGLASNYAAAVRLARAGIQAAFFVIPSFVDRTVAAYVRHHAERGVQAFPPDADGSTRGLSTSEVREMVAMGHRVGAHPNAHRDLGRLHLGSELRYEIGEAMDRMGELTGAECRDFAVGFGQPENLSAEAADYLMPTPNVFMCHRGLNVPGRTQRFLLRHAIEPHHPFAFTRICLEGGADHRLVGRMREMEDRVGRLPATEAPRDERAAQRRAVPPGARG